MAAYYNEIDPQAAQWLRNLIAAGLIAPGDVDERSIEDVAPDDLTHYTQCHFFAGVGVWSYALRRAGWSDDLSVWTGSCPCQPFSSAGKRGGFDDERHLWPHFHWLIQERRPAVVFGEQVASKAVEPWIDLVQADVEALGYAFGCIPFPSAGVGAPHIRDRAFWVADASGPGFQKRVGNCGVPRKAPGPESRQAADARSIVSGVADTQQHSNSAQEQAADHRQSQTDRPTDWLGGRGVSFGGLAHSDNDRSQPGRARPEAARHGHTPDADGSAERMADAELQQRPPAAASGDETQERQQAAAAATRFCRDNGTSPTNGFWRDADWLFCRDGKWRPVEPGTQPLAHGAPARVVRLRAYGNAINAEAAQAFIESWLEI